MRHTESNLQIACVRWFSLQYPELYHHFFSVPNGGLRRLTTAKIMKAEGAKAGVSDLLLLVPNKFYSFLCIEMKTPTGRQNDNQKSFQESIEKYDYGKYVICRSVDEFRREVTGYLQTTAFGTKSSITNLSF